MPQFVAFKVDDCFQSFRLYFKVLCFVKNIARNRLHDHISPNGRTKDLFQKFEINLIKIIKIILIPT